MIDTYHPSSQVPHPAAPLIGVGFPSAEPQTSKSVIVVDDSPTVRPPSAKS